MVHHQKKSLHGDRGRLVIASIVVFAAAYLLLSNGSDRPMAMSAEARFTDITASGLVVVPASGASEASYTGAYTGTYTSTYTTSYAPTCGAGAVLNSSGLCACINGLNIAQYPSCVCPTGQAQSGSICLAPPPTTNSYAPGTGSYTPATGSYTPTTGSYTSATSCWDGSSPDTNGNCPPCPTGYTQVGNTCVPTDNNPHFSGFPTTLGFNASGHLEVRPSLLRSGDTTRVFWNVTNVLDCTVRGSNGDGAAGSVTGAWNSLGSGSAGKTTGPITSRTDYTLFCHSLPGATPSTITETRTVNVIPQWYEPPGQQ